MARRSTRLLLGAALMLPGATAGAGAAVASRAVPPAATAVSTLRDVGWIGGTQSEAPEPGPTVSYGSGGLQPLVPQRLLDTRTGVGAPAGRIGPAGIVELDVTGQGGVPETGVGAVVLNVTAVAATAGSFVTVWPTGAPRPVASNLNVAPGDTVPNLVVVKVGAGGRVSLFNRFGEVDLVADVAGWFPEGAGLEPLVPARVLDTRDGIGASAGRVGPDGVVDLRVTGRGGVPESGVGAVVLNVTAVAATAASFVTVWPSGTERPVASNLNVAPGDTVPNLVVVKVGDAGRVSLFNRFGEVDLVADVAGWFPEGGGFVALVPDRILDTRSGNGAPPARVGPDGRIDVQVAGRGNVPGTGVGAVVLNVTAVAPTTGSFVTVWPAGVERPLASNLNVVAGQTVPNLVIVKVADDGRVSFFNRFGDVDLVADVAGWFPAGSESTTTLTPGRSTVLAGPGDVVSLSGQSVVLGASADVPKVGGFLAVFPHAAAPAGASGRVAAVAAHPDGTVTVTLEAAALEDMFADMDVYGAFAHDAIPVPTASPLVTQAMSCDSEGAVSSQPEFAFGGVGGSIDFDLSDRYLRVTVNAAPTLTWSVSAEQSFSCEVRLAKVPFGLVGPVLFAVDSTLTFGVTAAVSGATLSASAPVSVGFEYDDGAIENLSNAELTGSAEGPAASVAVTVGVEISPEAKAFGIVGVEASIAPQATATFELPECVKVEGSITFGIEGEVDAWFKEWEVELGSRTIGPKELYRRRCGGSVWTGTISVNYSDEIFCRPTSHCGNDEYRHSADLTFTLDPRGEQTSVSDDGAGDYLARVDGVFTYETEGDLSSGSGGVFCALGYFKEIVTTQTPGVRRRAVALRGDEPGGWRISTAFIFQEPEPSSAEVGNTSSTFESWCNEHVVGTTVQTIKAFGFEPSVSFVDNDPDPGRLTGTTSLSKPHDNSNWDEAFTLTMTYDLTLVTVD